ncbi:MAG: chlorophyll a/b-binding protein [Halothece sp.]
MSEETSTEKTKTDSRQPEVEAPAFGWTPYAERMNGRFAMLGFIILLLIELISNQDIFTWLGLR